MNRNYTYILFIIYFFTLPLVGQNCQLAVSGVIIDEGTQLPLPYVSVDVQEANQGTVSDADGGFLLSALCPGTYHLIFSHIGCDPIKIHLDIARDTILKIQLAHTIVSLDNVIVQGNSTNYDNQASVSVGRQQIEDNANQALSELIANEVGVSLIRNGSAISKPIVNGMYGNRLTILNHGVEQSGQTWGNDHSPEIDPQSADRITVLKGANALEYGGANLGSVILIEPKKIGQEPHLHGHLNYTFETNGRGHNLNTRFQKYTPKLAWRLNTSLKRFGDRRTANYFLNNTGSAEGNISLQLEKSWNDKLFTDVYLSSFNTNLGILRGSHIGNLTDLESALAQEVPFFTEPDFSYAIDSPEQKVSHHLIKWNTKYYFDETQSIQLLLAGQQNIRKEFDVRRGGRTDIPSLSLNQFTFNADLKYQKNFTNNLVWKLGYQQVITDNTNDPDTGILPLIPDYFSWRTGIFSSLAKEWNALEINFGLRYDLEKQNVAAISNSLPRDIIRYNNTYDNIGAILGAKYSLSNKHIFSFQSGYATRNPAINELYSNGLHQGVSGLELGDINLNTETAIKQTIEYNWLPSALLSFHVLAYLQHIQDYIYLEPQDEIRLTIRGAFPVFKYEQTDAQIYGLDLATQFTLGSSFFGEVKYSYLVGQDITQNVPLIFMPPNSIYSTITYRAKTSIHLASRLHLDQLEVEFNSRAVFEQSRVLAAQDFVAAPSGYHLLGAKISTNIVLRKYKLRTFLKVDNILNIAYRDYLNRTRYFADDLGLSFVAGLNFKF